MTSQGIPEVMRRLSRGLAAGAGGEAVAPLGVVAHDRRCAGELTEEIRCWARAQGAHVFTGSWQRSLRRPFGGIAELAGRLAEWVRAGDPDLLDRFSLALANLLPAWRREAGLRDTRELRSRLADFALYGDPGGLREFYWRRDTRPWMAAELGRLFSQAATALVEATGRPGLLLLDGVPAADDTAQHALGVLGRYASRAPAAVCAVFAGSPRDGGPGDPWQMISAESVRAEDRSAARLPSEVSRLLAAGSVLALPTGAADWRSLAQEAFAAPADGDVEELIEQGWVEAPREDVLAVATGSRRTALLASLDAPLRQRLHRLSLDREQADPFVTLWHAERAGATLEDSGLAALRREAMGRAWGVSDYRCAIGLARRAASRREVPQERDLVLALLAYERGCHLEAERRLVDGRLRVAGGTDLDAPTRQLLLGYNAVFGLGEFDRGRRILADACRLYEEGGRTHDVNSVRNSMAFALARTGRLDAALNLEETAFASLHRQGADDAFLAIILRLNLARLQRNAGRPEVAADLLRSARDDSQRELSPYLLLILHTALAEIHVARGNDPDALAAVVHGYELARDLKLDYVSDPVLGALSRILGRRLAARLSRADEALVYFELVLAVLCGRLGMARQAEAWLRSARTRWPGADDGLTPGDAMPAVVQTPAAARGDAAPDGLWSPLVEEDCRATPDSAAERLASGHLLALVRRSGVEGGGMWSHSLLLFDPRRADLAARAKAEVGAERWSGIPAALATESAAGLFQPPLDPSLPGYQEATLRGGERQRLAAVTPILLRVQVLSPSLDRFLAELVLRFTERTGIGLLAALPFHLRNRDLADDPGRAFAAFLVSSADHLLLGDRLLVKRHGREALENLLPFRPRLSRNAEVLPAGAVERGLVIRVWVWSHRSHFRLNEAMRSFLGDCDGRSTLAELLPEWRRRLGGHPQADRQIHVLLRELWHRGAVCFDPPSAELASRPAPWAEPAAVGS